MEFLFTNQIASIEAIIVFTCLFIIVMILLLDFYNWIIRVIGVLTPRKEYIQETKKSTEEETPLIDSIAEKNEVIEEYLATKKSEEIPSPIGEPEETVEQNNNTSGIDDSSPYIDLIKDLPVEEFAPIQSENTLELAHVSVIEEVTTGDELQNENDDGNTIEAHSIDTGESGLPLSAGNDTLENTKLETITPEQAAKTLEILKPDQEGDISDESGTIQDNSLGESFDITQIDGDVKQEGEIATPHMEVVADSIDIAPEEAISEPLSSESLEESITHTEDEAKKVMDIKDTSDVTKISNTLEPEVGNLDSMIPEEIPEDKETEDEAFIGKEVTTYIEQSEIISTEAPALIDQEPEKSTTNNKPTISPEKKEKLSEIINTVKTLVARGHFIEARGMIINGLSFHKDNRDLNILLAELYERDRDYPKAEYIFKDMARIYPEDTEILTHLASNLAIQRKYDVSYELYKKVLSISGGTEDLLYTLTHLASELSLPEDAYAYARAYLHQYPKSPEILWLMAQAQISMGERKFAIETLIKLKNLTPYNQEIVDLIQKLVMEQELAGNFGEEK